MLILRYVYTGSITYTFLLLDGLRMFLMKMKVYIQVACFYTVAKYYILSVPC